MSDLTAKFTALEEQLATQAAVTDGYIDTVEAKLQLLADNLDTIIINNAANTRALLNAMNQAQACATCPTTPLIGTPPTDATTSETSEYCQRVQAFLTFIDLCCTYADAVGDLPSAFSTGYVTSIVDEIRVTMDDEGIPYPGWLDTVAIAAAGVNYVINRAILGGSTHAMFDPIRETLQAAMYAAGSVSGSLSAYNAGIAAADGLAAARPVLNGVAYGDVANYFLDPSSTPNLTPYDGGICGSGGCIELTSTLTTYPGSAMGQAIWWEGDFNGSNCTPASYCADGPAWLDENRVGWTITAHGPCDVYHNWNFASTHLEADEVLELPDTNFMAIQNYPSTTPFSITLCPPAEE